MGHEVDEDGCVVLTGGCEVSTGGMSVVIGASALIGVVCGVLLTNAYKALDFQSGVYNDKSRVVKVNATTHEGHEYLFLTESGRDGVFGLCHSPVCKCRADEREYLHESVEGLKCGVSVIGQCLQSATEHSGDETKRTACGTNAVHVSGVPTVDEVKLVGQRKSEGKWHRCDADGKPNPKGKYVRKELSTSKVVDTSELWKWKSGRGVPTVKASMVTIGVGGDIRAVLKDGGKEERVIYKGDHSDVQALEMVEEHDN